MSDLISRQAAISLAGDLQIHDDEYHMYNQALNNYCAEIMGLPPAQPETREKRTETHACDLMPSAEPEPCEDTVSRADVIDMLEMYPFTEYGEYESARETVKRLPSVKPKRKKGTWIDHFEDGFVECPFCHSATNCDGNRDELHYCFSCGAELR